MNNKVAHPHYTGHYSVVRRAGAFLFSAGIVPRNSAREVIGSTVQEQTSTVFDNLRQALAEHGSSLSDIVKVQAYLADMSEWDSFNTEYARQMGPLRPVRTTTGCTLNGVKVEIDVIAYLGNEAPALEGWI